MPPLNSRRHPTESCPFLTCKANWLTHKLGIGNADSLQLYVRLNGDTVTADWMPVDSVVTYKSAGAYTALPALRYDLGARLPDSTTNTFSRTGVSFAGGHAYTVTARGNITVSTGTTAHFLDSTENR